MSDLIERLRMAERNSAQTVMGSTIFGEAADALEAKDKRIAELENVLREIAKGEGRYSMDRMQHANNTIEDMIGLAEQALKGDNDE